jgi:condensin complex subunit 3
MAPSPPAILDDLQHSLATIFNQTQLTIANHRKNCVSLYKIHLQAGEITRKVKDGAAVKLVGERLFGDAFIDMVTRILVVKKGPATADRTVKFIGEYVKFVNEKGTPSL